MLKSWMFFSVSFQVLGCLFYAYYIFVRLCIPQFRSISMQLFDLRAMVLCGLQLYTARVECRQDRHFLI